MPGPGEAKSRFVGFFQGLRMAHFSVFLIFSRVPWNSRRGSGAQETDHLFPSLDAQDEGGSEGIRR